MVNLIKYELKKHFLKRSILIAILIFSVINFIKIHSIYQENSYIAESTSPIWHEVYWKLYDQFSGVITQEKIEELLSIYRPLEQKTADLTASTRTDDPNTYTGNVYSDYYLLTRYYVQPMEYAYMYQFAANDIVGTAQNNMIFYDEIGNKYKYRENQMIAKLFANRSITDLSYTEMYQYYLEYDFSSLLVLLICLYGLVGVFVSEKEADMDTLLLTTVSGGRKTVLAKIIASMLFIFVVCLWFWLLDFVGFSIIFGSLEGAALPIYTLKSFENACINLSMSQYAIVSAVIKTGGMMVLGEIFLLISSASKNAMLPFSANLVVTGIAILHKEIMEGSGYILAKIANPFILVANSELFRQTEFVNFLGIPVQSYVGALGLGILMGIVFLFLLLFTGRKNAIVKGKAGANNEL
ncbi:ABC transporter permease [Marinisporobacter balticus]|uniref:ABC-2 family transporter n=1 Tax=Marinisporobacter balticus TaxID=2018667 RepID=A0A4R2KZM0_9FIRM|nr:ABC transporter permease [Marinisporobacter balticus]TCO72165.1 hypothetical protein EV214_11928 [Marinisporobacter balticus]